MRHSEFSSSKRLKRDINALNTNINTLQIQRRSNIDQSKKSEHDLSFKEMAKCLSNYFDFKKFNKVQSECFKLIYETDHNAVISAPTGSGKSVLFELAILRLYKDLNINPKELPLAIYIAPMKALCQEKHSELKNKYGKMNLKVVELTGDTELKMMNETTKAHIVLTTPEKWDAFTRRWKEHKKFIQRIKLLLIDEVHLLNTDRGHILEAIIARMLSISNLIGQAIRIIAQSATIPNIEDLCDWLNVDKGIGLKSFGEEYRPIRLEKHVLGYPAAKNEFLFERALNFKLASVIKQYSNNRATIVFCQTQKGTVTSAQKLKQDLDPLLDDPNHRMHLNKAAEQVKDKSLQRNLNMYLHRVGKIRYSISSWGIIKYRS